MRRNSIRAWVFLVIVSVLISTFPSALSPAVFGAGQATPAAASSGVDRDVIMSGNPEAAPVQVLELVRYTIPAGIELPPHTHPGMQVATIQSGTLHYTVLLGKVPLKRATSPDGTPEPDIAVTAQSGEVAIGPGDSFIEAEGVIHFGRNLGPEPVVILVASLFASDQPPARIVPLDATPVS